MKTIKRFCLGAVALAMLCLGGTALAVPQWCADMGGPPCKGGKDGGGGEPIGTNNLSFPVIWSDNVLKPDFVRSSALWTGASITDPEVECVLEDDLVETVPPEIFCYYGRKNLGIDETTGQRSFEGPVQTWWLQQRQSLGNSWQVFNITDAEAEAASGATVQTPVIVSGVDAGDLMESSTVIKAKQVRIEFTLLKRIRWHALLRNTGDPNYKQYLTDGAGACQLNENIAQPPNNCFAAHNMSGAVPGTDQSINETQGTDYFGVGGQAALIDPKLVRSIKNYVDPNAVQTAAAEEGEPEPDPSIVVIDPPAGVDATVYSACSRLIIQPISDSSLTPIWSSHESGGVASGNHGGYWVNGISPPVVDIAAWDSGTAVNGGYSAEINAGGALIYGYNWNTQSLAEYGPYRVTFSIEGDACPYARNTVFNHRTRAVNVGERRPLVLLRTAKFSGTGDEGGLAYVDIEVSGTSESESSYSDIGYPGRGGGKNPGGSGN